MKARLFVLLPALIALAAPPLQAQGVEQVIAKARAYLGTEAALGAVQNIHFTGVIQVDATTRVPVEIIFQKDYQQRITVTGSKVIETTALDGYDAWQKRANPLNLAQWQVTLLDAVQVKRLRANTWENLNFFAGLERKGGTVQLQGEVEVDGVTCVSLAFIHGPDIVFQRFFDKATGRLIKTVTENGAEIREEGEVQVNGIRFPQKVINKAASGQVTTISFDKITLNEPIPTSEFAVPALPIN
jgi:hypothetical protein